MGIKVVIGVIGADCHSVGNKILDHAFNEAGLEVINIGVLSSQEEFINAAIETNASVIVVSSLYGHGEMDCRGLKNKCIESGIEDVLLYAGGNLVVGKQEWTSVKQRFLTMGFNRVYPPGTLPSITIGDIQNDIQEMNF